MREQWHPDWTSQFRWKFLTGVLLLSLCFVKSRSELTLASVPNDAVGNSVDDKSVITWAAITEGEAYKSDSSYDDGGMGPLFDFARSFVNTCFPNGFPYDLVQKAKDRTLDLAGEAKGILQDFVGYAVALVVGILFVIIVPIIGLCFCCCRCCGNCGGKRMQKSNPNASCKRKVFGIILFLLVLMIAVGMICVFVSNERMTVALDKVSDSVIDQMKDVNTFLNNTVEQVKQVAVTNFDFTKSVLFRDLDSIGYLLGIPVKLAFQQEKSIKDALESVDALFATVNTASSQLQDVVTKTEALKNNIKTLESNLTAVQNDINSILSSCGATDCPVGGRPDTSGLTLGLDKNNIPDLSSQQSKIDTVKGKNISGLAREEFDSIPEKVQNDSASTVSGLRTKINDYSKDIKPLLSTIEKFQTDAKKSVNLDNLESEVISFNKDASKYNKYRWYAGIALTCIILLIVMLQFLGLSFGVFGSSARTLPTERGCLSNFGGIMLMASVGFIFIFSWLLMLLTTLTFMIGAPVERYFCQPLSDSELTIITKLVDEMHVVGGGSSGSFLANTLYNDPSVDLSIAGILKDCRENKPAYAAFKMENYKNFNISALTDYKSKLDINKQLDSLDSDVKLGSIKLLTTDLSNQLNDLKTAATQASNNIITMNTELAKATVNVALGTFATDLRSYSSSLPAAAATTKTELNKAADNLDAIQSGPYTDTEDAKNALQTSGNNLNSTVSGIPNSVTDLETNLQAAQNFIQNNGSQMIKQEATAYVNRLIKVVDSFVSDALDALNNEIGKCIPVWNLYNGLLVNTVCKYGIDALNGFWFSLGWCIFFFMPSLIFSVKLAKYYRTMIYLDSFDSTLGGGKDYNPQGGVVDPYNSGPMIGSNKVGHADKF